MIDTNGMKVIKQGVIDDDFRNWMDTFLKLIIKSLNRAHFL